MTATSCATVRRQLAWFVGGDVDVEQGTLVRAHLRECARCRRDASRLQQSRKALQGLADPAHVEKVGVDDTMFTTIYTSVVAAVERESLPNGGFAGRGWIASGWRAGVRHVLSIAAAVVLFLFGWWVIREPATLSVLEREPIGAALSAGGPVKVVPHVGPRVSMRQLGMDSEGNRAPLVAGIEDGLGLGMMGRWRLRTLEDIDLSLWLVGSDADAGVVPAGDR